MNIHQIPPASQFINSALQYQFSNTVPQYQFNGKQKLSLSSWWHMEEAIRAAYAVIYSISNQH